MTTQSPPTADCSLWFLEGIQDQRDRIQHIPINSVPFRIGRSSELGLCLPVPAISKVHAEIVVVGDKLFLRDLGSTNGTFVNGYRVESTVPIGEGDLLQFAAAEFRVRCDQAFDCELTLHDSSYKTSGVVVRFQHLLAGCGIIPQFQPIVAFDGQTTIGYELLARSILDGLESPMEMFFVAHRLGAAVELSEMLRREGVKAAAGRLPLNSHYFVNTHPAENLSNGVLQEMAELRRQYPDFGFVVEIHEAVVTDLEEMKAFKSQLADLNIQLAYDDFGAGQARLMDLVKVPPDYLKFDINLIRDVHCNEQQQKMVSSLVSMVRDIGITAIAEGIECAEDAEVCRELGFNFAQGHFFGRPATVESLTGKS